MVTERAVTAQLLTRVYRRLDNSSKLPQVFREQASEMMEDVREELRGWLAGSTDALQEEYQKANKARQRARRKEERDA